jgi:hypothetical protein
MQPVASLRQDVKTGRRDGAAVPGSAAGTRSARAGRRSAALGYLGLALKRLLPISITAVLFLAISVLLARFLSVENVERDADLALIQAQARGDVNGMLARLGGCRQSSSCVARVREDAGNPRLRRAGAVKILSLKSSTAYAVTGGTGKTRLAWTVIGKLPVVQCIEVRRTGNALAGLTVTLLSLSAPISNEADC